jgi:hypothetical protein
LFTAISHARSTSAWRAGGYIYSAQSRAVRGEVEREQGDREQLEEAADYLRRHVQDAGGAVLDVVAQPVGAEQALLDVDALQVGLEVRVDPVDDGVEVLGEALDQLDDLVREDGTEQGDEPCRHDHHADEDDERGEPSAQAARGHPAHRRLHGERQEERDEDVDQQTGELVEGPAAQLEHRDEGEREHHGAGQPARHTAVRPGPADRGADRRRGIGC